MEIDPKMNATTPPCPACRTLSTEFWFTKNNSAIYRCTACKLIFVHATLDNSAVIYSDQYFCGAHHGYGYVNYEADKNPFIHEFHKYLDSIEKYIPNKGSLLDVGAATGAFLIAAEKRGWETKGIDISEYAARQGRKQGLSISADTLESAQLEPRSFDAITLLDVFEHLQNSHESLDRIYTLLKPGGLLAMNLPDAGSFFARLMGKRWPLIIPPEHLRLFTHANLEALLVQHHFFVIHTDRVGKRFTPAYILHILSTMHHNNVCMKLSQWIRKTPLNRFLIPLNLRDTMFIIARKDAENAHHR